MKRGVAIFLATLMSFGYCVNAFADGVSESEALTKGEYADLLLEQASKYNSDVQIDDIIMDTSEEARSKALTKVEALAMLRRAFGDLPNLTGDLERTAPEVQEYTDLPFWSVDDITELSNAGVLSEDGGEIGANDYVSSDYIKRMSERMYRLFGTNVNDDFYTAVNKDYLDNSVLEESEPEKTITTDVQNEVNDVISDILTDIISNTQEEGSTEQKVKDFYLAAANVEGRNRLGIKPIEPYLKALREVNNDEELLQFSLDMASDTTVDCLLGFSVIQQYDDNESFLPVYQGYIPTFDREDYEEEDSKSISAYKQYLVKILQLGGEDEKTAEDKAQTVIDFEYEMSKNVTPDEEYTNVESGYSYYSLADLQELFKTYNPKAIADVHGFKLEDKKIVVYDPKKMEFYASYFDGEHTEVLKDLAEVSILTAYSGRLNEDFIEASNMLTNAIYGFDMGYSISTMAYYSTLNVMDGYLGKIYCERNMTDEKRSEIEKMVNNIRDCYKDIINENTWMSSSTKAEAIKKLDNIKLIVGEWDSGEDEYSDMTIVGPNGGDDAHIKNVYSILRLANDQVANLINGNAVVESVSFSPYMVNAMYAVTFNTMIIPAGIVNSPFYSVDASDAENYGSIGVIIGHEMSHAFDTTGANYDENGRYKNWWADEDYGKFSELADKVEEYYDGAEAATGITINGKLSLDENISDIGGLEVALDALKKVSDGEPDYDAFFRSYALSYVASYDRYYLEYIAKDEVHAPDSIRVNYTVKVMDEFYQAYDVTENDGMYLSEEDRVRIW